MFHKKVDEGAVWRFDVYGDFSAVYGRMGEVVRRGGEGVRIGGVVAVWCASGSRGGGCAFGRAGWFVLSMYGDIRGRCIHASLIIP